MSDLLQSVPISLSPLILGILLALAASVSNNFGIVLQKKVVNALPGPGRGDRFFMRLAAQPLWLLGLVLQMGVSAAFLLAAQYLIGPTLVPGLQGIGLIVLAVASVQMNQESLALPEITGILLLIAATGLVAFSELHIKIAAFDLSQGWFLSNTTAYTATLVLLCLALTFAQRHSQSYARGLLLTILGGVMYALSDFWTSLLVGTISAVFKQQADWIESILFIQACVLLVGSNILAIGVTQRAFQYGPASILIPIRHGPTLLAPIFVYSFVYNRSAPQPYSLGFFLVGVLLVLLSAFLLGRQEARFSDN